MISFFIIIVAILIPIIIGGCLLFFLLRDRKTKLVEFLILAFSIGNGLLSYSMFWLLAAGVPLSFHITIFSFLAVILVILMIILYYKQRGFRGLYKKSIFLWRRFSKFKNVGFIESILIIIILFEVFFAFSGAMYRPHFAYDVLANWGWRAKLIFYQSYEFFNPTSNLFLGGGPHQHYPLHLSLLMAWIYLWLSRVDDALVNIIFALYFLSLIGLFYINLRHFVSRKVSLTFTMFLSTLPLLNYHSFNAYADLTLSFYFLFIVVYLFRYLEDKNRANLILTALLAAISVWIKNTGLILSAIPLAVGLIYMVLEKKVRLEWKNFLIAGVCFLIFVGPWLFYKKLFGLVSTGLPPTNEWHPNIFPAAFEQIFLFNSFHLWPGIFVIILLLNWRQILIYPYRYFFLIILGTVVAYLLRYLLTSPSYQFAIDGTLVGRDFLVVVPMTIFYGALLFREQDTPRDAPQKS